MKDGEYWQKAKSTKKVFPEPVVTEQYEKPIGPQRQTRGEQLTHIIDRAREAISPVSKSPILNKAKVWAVERGHQINDMDAPRPAPAPRTRSASRHKRGEKNYTQRQMGSVVMNPLTPHEIDNMFLNAYHPKKRKGFF